MTSSGHPTDRVWLTPLLNRISNVAGEEAAIALGRARPGERVYIPEQVTADHWLVEVVGLEAAEKIAAAYGSMKIEIPQAIAGDKRRRAAAIADLIEKGYSTNAIVRRLGVSQNTVAEHRRRRPPADPQLKLL
jgi:DNA-binding NarL/FixJ family response regulator